MTLIRRWHTIPSMVAWTKPSLSLKDCRHMFVLSTISASCKARRPLLHEGGTPLLIIGAVEARFDGALNHSKVAIGLGVEELRARQLRRTDGEWGVSTDHRRIVLHIRRQFVARHKTIDQPHAQGFLAAEAPAGKQDLTRIGRS